MGSNDEASSSVVRRYTLVLKARKPKVDSLKTFAGLMTKIQHNSFHKRYNKILELLEVNVQEDAITALAQFYDSPMKCFTFQDFQMAPTLEEYAQILGYPLENIKPYQYMDHYPSTQTIANVLRVQRQELENKMQNRSCYKGIPQKYLEERMKKLVEIREWDSFMDVLALTVYGVILFPHIPEYIDIAAIDVFLAWRDRGESPIPAVLADTNCTFHSCQKNKNSIVCCLPVLYVWLITHVVKSKCRQSCPIQDFKQCNVKVMNSRQWAQTLMNLNENTIRWYPQWQDINEDDKKDVEELQKARRAWNQVVRKSTELGKRSCGAKESYRQWIRDRVQKVMLPFHCSTPIVKETIDETHVSAPVCNVCTEVVEELKTALLRSEEEKKNLEEKLEEVLRKNKTLRLENTQLKDKLDKTNKRARVDER